MTAFASVVFKTNILLNTKWIDMPIPKFTGLNAGLLFIREEYRALEEEIEHQAIKNIVVTGNPGIGKSMFALYMLIRHVI